MTEKAKPKDKPPRGKASAAGDRSGTMAQTRLDEKLDEALKETFPASDPFMLTPDEDPNSVPTYASPPCFMHELDPSYLGYLNRAEVLPLLNQLLEGERAGARGVGEMSKQAPGSQSRTVLRGIARDEARFCAMLTKHIVRLGGTPSAGTSQFYEKLSAVKAQDERLELVNRGQGWVVRKLRETLPRIEDSSLHSDLTDMLKVHERNIKRCERLKI